MKRFTAVGWILLSIVVLSVCMANAQMGNMTGNMKMPMDMKMPMGMKMPMMPMNMTKNMTLPMGGQSCMPISSMSMILLQNVSLNLVVIQNLTEITNYITPVNAADSAKNTTNGTKLSAKTK